MEENYVLLLFLILRIEGERYQVDQVPYQEQRSTKNLTAITLPGTNKSQNSVARNLTGNQ